MTDATTAAAATTAPAHGTRIAADLQAQIDQALARAVDEQWARRIWERDTSVWTSDEKVAGLIANRLGWLDLPQTFTDEIEVLEAFAAGVRDEGLVRAVVAGMGGSSLAPAVLAASMEPTGPGIVVDVLDSTDPDAVRAATDASDPAGTLYIIASKSGTTTEPLAFLAHFWDVEDRTHHDIPEGNAGLHFVAISDPMPSIMHIPHNDLFREVFLNPEDIGGRYSALSYVGLVPAALMGLDLRPLLERRGAHRGTHPGRQRQQPGDLARRHARNPRPRRPRQADARYRAALRVARHVDRAARRGEHRQARPGDPARGDRDARRARRLLERPRLRSCRHRG